MKLDRAKCERVWYRIHYWWIFYPVLLGKATSGDPVALAALLLELYQLTADAEGLSVPMVKAVSRCNWVKGGGIVSAAQKYAEKYGRPDRHR